MPRVPTAFLPIWTSSLAVCSFLPVMPANVAVAAPLLATNAVPAAAVNNEAGDANVMEGVEKAARRLQRILKQLNLTAEQRSKIAAIHARYSKEIRGLAEQTRQRRAELLKLMKDATATGQQALAKQHELQALQNKVAELRLAEWFAARANLTAEQLKRLATLRLGLLRGQHKDRPKCPGAEQSP
ncbi:MAG: Spy/CpxP family protein refolding chaperone [Cyanobacteria bacterium NC_groundwater_1444_Ag_S-0.65um_54_12]|nr:Spy/CpxP family protein refolding chaperone [Cyanobacteria bacterium NC_groundwater_1444_Ag_S-0.65um_54_12]